MASVPDANDQALRRLRHGEFPDPEHVVARQAFLDALVDVDASMLLDLERWAQRLAAESPTTTLARYDAVVRHWVEDPRQTRLLDEAVPLDAEILNCLTRKRLSDKWIEAAVLYTLYWWANAIVTHQEWKPRIVAPPSKDATGTYFRSDGVVWKRPTDLDTADPATGKFDLDYHGWFNLRAHPRAVIKAEVMAAIEKEVDRQLDVVDAACRASGLQGTEGKRNDPGRHFQWLVRYQVLGEGYSEIAESPGGGRTAIDRHSVRPAIRNTALLIGLTLRDPDPPGRPWGS